MAANHTKFLLDEVIGHIRQYVGCRVAFFSMMAMMATDKTTVASSTANRIVQFPLSEFIYFKENTSTIIKSLDKVKKNISLRIYIGFMVKDGKGNEFVDVNHSPGSGDVSSQMCNLLGAECLCS